MTPMQLADRIDERCLTFYGISWLQFEAIEAAFANISGVKFAYLDETLDIMTVSPEHEDAKGTIRALVEAYMREKGIRFYIRGGSTLGSQELGVRKEPDEFYNLNAKKDLPDLAIEVVITSGGLDKLALYKRLGVPEVWFWQDDVLDIYVLKEDYEKMKRSELLPNLDIEMLTRYIT
jgi:Uma2 family endonuclease